jgi:hypothetical protein
MLHRCVLVRARCAASQIMQRETRAAGSTGSSRINGRVRVKCRRRIAAWSRQTARPHATHTPIAGRSRPAVSAHPGSSPTHFSQRSSVSESRSRPHPLINACMGDGPAGWPALLLVRSADPNDKRRPSSGRARVPRTPGPPAPAPRSAVPRPRRTPGHCVPELGPVLRSVSPAAR